MEAKEQLNQEQTTQSSLFEVHMLLIQWGQIRASKCNKDNLSLYTKSTTQGVIKDDDKMLDHTIPEKTHKPQDS